MKKIIRLTESDLHDLISRSVKRIIKEDVLGNNWHENQEEDSVLNNYEPFENQIQRYKEEDEFRNNHDWGVEGEGQFDPTEYDPEAYIDYDDHEPTDNELYHYGNW